MALDRGRLAKIDRRLLAELSHDAGPQMVKVPVSAAAWSTWRRYCDVLGFTMGEAIAVLIGCELATVVDGLGTGVQQCWRRGLPTGWLLGRLSSPFENAVSRRSATDSGIGESVFAGGRMNSRSGRCG